MAGRVGRLRWLFGIPKVLRHTVQDQTEVGKALMVLRKELRLGAALRLLSGGISPDIYSDNEVVATQQHQTRPHDRLRLSSFVTEKACKGGNGTSVDDVQRTYRREDGEVPFRISREGEG